jgi:hypothetical protein
LPIAIPGYLCAVITHLEPATERPASQFRGNRSIGRTLIACADPMRAGIPPGIGTPSKAELRHLVEEADAHGVLPALLAKLNPNGSAEPHADLPADTLPRHRMSQTFSAILRHHGEIIRDAARHLPVTVVKGMTFARALYPDPTLRPFTDIDLLVAPSAVPAINAILGEQDFSFVADGHDPRRLEAKWVHRNSPLLMVEVHTNLVHHPKLRGSLSLTYEDIAEAPEAPAVLLSIATLHGALHRFERLKHVVDICQAARNLTQAGEESRLAALLKRSGGRFAAIVGLDLAYRLFGEPRCREIARGLGSTRYATLARLLVSRSAIMSTMNDARFYHSWRRQMFRQLLQRSRHF